MMCEVRTRHTAAFNIRVLGRTPERPSARFCGLRAVSGTFPGPNPEKRPDNFCAAAYATRVNGGRFREGNTVKARKKRLIAQQHMNVIR
jgi:hypothetical protein